MSEIIVDTTILDSIPVKTWGAIASALRQISAAVDRQIKTDWSPNSPSAKFNPPAVDLGNLTNSTKSKEVGSLHYEVQVGAEYAIHLEYGTVHMAPRPFMIPAHEKVMAKELKKLTEEVFNAIT